MIFGPALAFVGLFSSFIKTQSLFTGEAIKFGTAYYTVTITLNFTLTTLICSRLIWRWRYIRSTALSSGGFDIYDRIVAIMIEAAVPYTLLGIAFLIPYAMENPIAVAFGEIWGAVVVRMSYFPENNKL